MTKAMQATEKHYNEFKQKYGAHADQMGIVYQTLLNGYEACDRLARSLEEEIEDILYISPIDAISQPSAIEREGQLTLLCTRHTMVHSNYEKMTRQHITDIIAESASDYEIHVENVFVDTKAYQAVMRGDAEKFAIVIEFEY